MNRTRVLSLVAFCIIVIAARLSAQEISRPFPFTISQHDTAHSTLLPMMPIEVAGVHGPTHLNADGHIIAKDGTRLKFIGTELVWNGNFLSSDESNTLAQHWRKLGFNAFRPTNFDYWGYGYDTYSLFSYYSNGTSANSSYTVQESQMAKFDTLIYNLKQNGIYTFLPLNSYHRFAYGEGIPYPDSSYGFSFPFTFLYPEAAALELAWAKTLLTHTNPLTHLAYKDDPAIAVLEFNAEYSLDFWWKLGRLNYIDTANAYKGQYTISYHQSRRLDTLYSTFLKNKYGSDAVVNYAWQGNPNVTSANLVVDGSFEDLSGQNWSVYALPPAKANLIATSPGYDSAFAGLVHITALDPTKNVAYIQLYNSTPYLGKDSVYEVSVWMKLRWDKTNPTMTSRAVAISVYDVNSGTQEFVQQYTIDTSWQQLKARLRTTYGGLGRVYAFLGSSLGDVLIDAYSLKKVPEYGLFAGEGINYSTVARLLPPQLALVSLSRQRDQAMFLDSLQSGFYKAMNRLVKDTLKCQSVVTFSQSGYWQDGADLHVFKGGDVMQSRQAWDYVSYTNNISSDSTAVVRGYPIVKDQGLYAMGMLASAATVGKAMVVGEFSTPNANQNASSIPVILPIYAAYQDWDGIFFTPWSSRYPSIFCDSLYPNYYNAGFNDIAQNYAFNGLMPFASKAFREGLATKATLFDTILHSSDDIFLATYKGGRGDFFVDGSLDPNVLTAIGVRSRYDASTTKTAAEYAYVPNDSLGVSDNNELYWDKVKGQFIATSPKMNAMTGYIGRDTIGFPKMRVARLDNAQDVLSLYYLPGDSGISQLVTTTRTQNTGQKWIDSTTYGNSYGRAPTIMSATTLHFWFKSVHDSVIVHALDSTGNRGATVIPAIRNPVDGWFSIVLDQTKTNTIWYQIEEKDRTLGVTPDGQEELFVTASPNPTTNELHIHLATPGAQRVALALLDDLGRVVRELPSTASASRAEFTFDTRSLASGHYTLRALVGERVVMKNISVVH